MAPAPSVKMTSTFIMPSVPPSVAAQLDYFLPGTSPADGSVMLQPVLAWGTNPTGALYTGASWSWPELRARKLIDVNVHRAR